MVACSAQRGDAVPGNGLPVRGLWAFNSGIGGLSVDFEPTALL